MNDPLTVLGEAECRRLIQAAREDLRRGLTAAEARRLLAAAVDVRRRKGAA
jgi:hypothetical protein